MVPCLCLWSPHSPSDCIYPLFCFLLYLLFGHSQAQILVLSPLFKEELLFPMFMQKNQHIHLPWLFFSVLMSHDAHSQGEHKELTKVWKQKLSPQRSTRFSVVSSPHRMDQYYVSAKAPAWGICYRNTRGCYVSGKEDRCRGTLYLWWYWQHSSCVLHLPSVVPQPHQSRVCSSLTRYPADLTLLQNTERSFLLKLSAPWKDRGNVLRWSQQNREAVYQPQKKWLNTRLNRMNGRERVKSWFSPCPSLS